MKKHRFDCGCEFDIVGEPITRNALPLLNFDAYDINPNCKSTWDMLGKGLTKGVFQLESGLGKQWTKTLKPREMEHLSALGALLRPGCLAVELEPGLSMTRLYCKRLNGELPVTSFHPALDPILARTYQVLVYQEQSMMIGRDIAGFDLKEMDVLRKGIGKKDEKVMSEVGELFLRKAKEKAVVPYEVAETIWGWIRKSGRYSFNASHSLSYGVIGYITAYIKRHFPVQFFASWLRYAQEKADPLVEISELVNEAKLFDVPVLPPDFRTLKKRFSTDGFAVRFGMSDVKGIGSSQITKIRERARTATTELGKPASNWSWLEVLLHFSGGVSASTMERLISVGAFDYFAGVSRVRKLEEFKLFASLTDKEIAWIQERKFSSFLDAMKALAQPRKPAKSKKAPVEPGQQYGGCSTEKRRQAVLSRIQLMENPPTPLEDFPGWVARTEAELLGVALTCSEVDALDPRDVNTTCKEYINGANGGFDGVILGVKIESVRTWKCKQGKNSGREMAYLTVSDSSCMLGDVVVFPDDWASLKDVLVEDSCVILRGERGRKNDGFVVKQACTM